MDKNSFKISVVVPVYNTAPYLDRCIKSLLGQTHNLHQIILVDDGSSDESGEICDTWAKTSSNILVRHTSNQGSGAARALGFSHATGDYIGFVDSDDYIHPSMYEILERQIRDRGTDIACCGFASVSNEIPAITPLPLDLPFEQFNGVERFRALVRDRDLLMSLCNKLYPAKLFKDEVWQVHCIHHEDFWMNIELFGRAEVVGLCRLPLYYYYKRAGSLSHQAWTQTMVDDMLAATLHLKTVARDEPELQALADSYYREKVLYIYTNILRSPAKRQLTAVLKDQRQQIRCFLGEMLKDKDIPFHFKVAAIGAAWLWPLYNWAAARTHPIERDTLTS